MLHYDTERTGRRQRFISDEASEPRFLLCSQVDDKKVLWYHFKDYGSFLYCP